MGPAAQRTEDAAQEVHHSGPVRLLARVGMFGRSLLWLVVGGLAVAVSQGNRAETDRQGALRAVAAQPLGEVLLWVVTVGFAGYALWRLLAAAVGHTEQESTVKRTLLRLLSLGQALLYGFLAVTTAGYLSGGGQSGGDDQTTSRAAQLMSLPYGRWLLGGIGAAVIVVGLVDGTLAVRREHDDRLDTERIPRRLRPAASGLGVVGRLGLDVVVALVGAFLVRAAWQFDPQDAKGLDATLATLAAQPHGTALLLLAALGLVAYGLWSLVETVWRSL